MPEAAATLPAPPSPAAQPPFSVPRAPFSLFLGLRYLKPRRTFVSVITVICVLGVALGVMLPIVVISVMTGYDTELKSKVLGFDPHIEVTVENGLVDHWRELREEVLKTPGVLGVSPYVYGPVLAEAHNQRYAPKIRAVEPGLEATVIDLKGIMGKGSSGKFDLDGDKCVIGVDLARMLNVEVGDTLTLYSPRNLDTLRDAIGSLKGKQADQDQIDQIQSMITPVPVTITGIFNSGRYTYDLEVVFIPLHLGQELYDMGGRVHGLSVKTDDAYHADRVAARLNEQFARDAIARTPHAAPGGETEAEPPPNIPHAQTWMELNAAFFGAVHTERMTMFVILFVVLIVAAFCVMNTLIVVTVQKTREIGIMKAIGADVWQIVRVFASLGIVIGLIGMVLGLGMGLGILAALNPFKRAMEHFFHVEVFAQQVYGFGSIPYDTKPWDVAVICVSMFAICSLAALALAYRAARLDPVKALRAEQ